MTVNANRRREVSLPDWIGSADADFLNSRYRIVSEAGQGTMGTVFRATHWALNREVAIKILLQDDLVDRFQREGRLLARLKSPHVVIVHNLEFMPSGIPVMVMEWVDGGDLEREIEAMGGRLSEETALSLMSDTCRGMLAAEEQCIVHRDLKPSNILIDEHHRALVTDFGLARPDFVTEGTLTGYNVILGTPYYMAPEQAEHASGADTRSDIYSFGATYYHALTGAPPFEAESFLAIFYKHKVEPLVPPRSRCPDISGATSALLERCLAKSPSERFQSFREILDELSGCA